MMDSDLHVKVLNSKLNPDLSNYINIAGEEMQYGWGIDVPRPESKPPYPNGIQCSNWQVTQASSMY